MNRALTTLLVWVCLASLAFAQGAASINGVITDQSGAVIPDVTITALQVETGISRTTVSNNAGSYSIPSLNPGQYRVQAEMAGFKTVVRSGITVQVGNQLGLNLVMQVGEVAETVEVTGEAPLVETTTSVVGGVVDNRTIQSLPLNGRGFADLALLQPNVILAATAGSGGNSGFGTKISISGMRTTANSFTLDGQDINNLFNDLGNVSGAAAGVEAIREFKVVTNPYSSEYGRSGGGEIQVVTKSGTNNFHGSVYEFLRNDKLDANRWENNAFGRGVKASLRRNQFGFSLGGPIVKDKTVFFGNYEGLRETLGTTRRLIVPDADAHRGFLPNAAGVLQSVGIAPNIRPYMDAYPVATKNLGNGTGEFPSNDPRTTSDNYILIRADHLLSPAHQLMGRYTQDVGDRVDPAGGVEMLFDASQTTATRFAAAGLTSVLSPRVVNSLSLYYSRSTSLNGSNPNHLLNDPSLFVMTTNQTPSGPNYGAILPTGLTPAGGRALLTGAAHNVYQMRDTLSLEADRHSLKFGANMELLQPNVFNSNMGGGRYNFQNIDQFMRGIVNSFTTVLPGSRLETSHTQWIIAFYAQDDFRFSPKLTFNVGLRYEMTTIPTERYNRFSTVRDYNSINKTLNEIIVLGPPFWNTNPALSNFGPRVGVAWSPDEKTSVRAGFGMFHILLLPHYWRPPMVSSAPFNLRANLTPSAAGVPIDFPNAFFTQPHLLAGALATDGIAFNTNQPTSVQYSFTVQRQLGASRMVRLGYAGSRGWHLTRDQSFNHRIPEVRPDGKLFFGPSPAAPVPNPTIGGVRMKLTDVNSFFNSFSASFEQRYAAGLNFQMSYTFGRSIDDSSRNIGAADFTTSEGGGRYPLFTPNDDRGLSTFDVRNTFSANVTYDLPWGSGRAHPLSGVTENLLGGWTVNALVRLTGGSPFGPSGGRCFCAVNRTTMGQLTGGPPNVVGKANSTRPQNAEQYFDPTVFVLPEPGFYGNAGRNIIIGPGTANVDFSLAKDVPLAGISEEMRLQFRGELFNILNRVNFYPPDGTLFDSRTLAYLPDIGRLTSTKSSRQIQLALKIVF